MIPNMNPDDTDEPLQATAADPTADGESMLAGLRDVEIAGFGIVPVAIAAVVAWVVMT